MAPDRAALLAQHVEQRRQKVQQLRACLEAEERALQRERRALQAACGHARVTREDSGDAHGAAWSYVCILCDECFSRAPTGSEVLHWR